MAKFFNLNCQFRQSFWDIKSAMKKKRPSSWSGFQNTFLKDPILNVSNFFYVKKREKSVSSLAILEGIYLFDLHCGGTFVGQSKRQPHFQFSHLVNDRRKKKK